MIRLMDILDEARDKEERSVWRTYANRFGARNTLGYVRYFPDRESATQYARGKISGPKHLNLKKAKSKEPKERKQTYDYVPPIEKDMERAS